MKRYKFLIIAILFLITSCNIDVKRVEKFFPNGRIKEICYRNNEDNYRIKNMNSMKMVS